MLLPPRALRLIGDFSAHEYDVVEARPGELVLQGVSVRRGCAVVHNMSRPLGRSVSFGAVAVCEYPRQWQMQSSVHVLLSGRIAGSEAGGPPAASSPQIARVVSDYGELRNSLFAVARGSWALSRTPEQILTVAHVDTETAEVRWLDLGLGTVLRRMRVPMEYAFTLVYEGGQVHEAPDGTVLLETSSLSDRVLRALSPEGAQLGECVIPECQRVPKVLDLLMRPVLVSVQARGASVWLVCYEEQVPRLLVWDGKSEAPHADVPQEALWADLCRAVESGRHASRPASAGRSPRAPADLVMRGAWWIYWGARRGVILWFVSQRVNFLAFADVELGPVAAAATLRLVSVTHMPDAAALSPRARWLEGSFIGRTNTVDGVLPDGAVLSGLVVRVRPDGVLSLRTLPPTQRAVMCGKVRPDPAVQACVASVLRQQEQRVRAVPRRRSSGATSSSAAPSAPSALSPLEVVAAPEAKRTIHQAERRRAPGPMSRLLEFARGLVGVAAAPFAGM